MLDYLKEKEDSYLSQPLWQAEVASMVRKPSALDILACGIAIYACLFGLLHEPGPVEHNDRKDTMMPTYYIPTDQVSFTHASELRRN